MKRGNITKTRREGCGIYRLKHHLLEKEERDKQTEKKKPPDHIRAFVAEGTLLQCRYSYVVSSTCQPKELRRRYKLPPPANNPA